MDGFHAKPPYTTLDNRRSLYTRRWWSESKETLICLEDLGRFHLCSVYQKLKRHLEGWNTLNLALPGAPDGSQPDAELLECIERELKRRDLDPEWQGGLRPGDPRLPAGREAARYPHPPVKR
jgi:hypothetical protein